MTVFTNLFTVSFSRFIFMFSVVMRCESKKSSTVPKMRGSTASTR